MKQESVHNLARCYAAGFQDWSSVGLAIYAIFRLVSLRGSPQCIFDNPFDLHPARDRFCAALASPQSVGVEGSY